MPTSFDRYRAVAPGDYAVEPLDDIVALFDRRSGLTHLVLSPVPEMIVAMATGPCTVAELTQRLGERFDLDAEGDAEAVIADRLRELLALGLVERVA